MSDLSLGALSAQLKLDAAGLDASVKQAIGGLDRVEKAAESTAKKTEDVGKVLQKALKGEVLVNAMNRVSSSLQGLGGEFKGLGEAVQGAGAVMQGLFQGNLFGAGVALAGVGISHLVKQFGEIQAMADAAGKAAASSAAAMADGYAKVASSLEEVTRKLHVQNDAKALGITLSEAEFRLKAQEIVGSIASLRSSAARSAELGAERRRTVGNTESTRGFEAAAAADNQLADQKAAQLKLLESTLRLDKATKAAHKPLSDFAKAMKEAREWTVEKAGLTMSTGDAARAAVAAAARMNLGGMRSPDGSINSEARERAARNAGYARDTSKDIVLDAPLSKRGTPTAFESDAGNITDQIYADLTEFAVDFSDVLNVGMAALSSVAPKTIGVLEAALKGDWLGALGQALSQSVEAQAIGKALDTGLSDIINALTEVIRPAVPVITMAINAVVSVAKIIGDVLSMLMQISGVNEVLALVFEAVKFLAAVLSVGAAAAQYALDALGNALKNAAIDFLSMFGDTWKGQIDDLRASLVTQGDIFTEMGKAFDDVMKVGYNAEVAAVGMGDAAAAADKVAQSFLNLPAGFKTAAAIYGATSASGEAFGGFAPPAAPGLPPLAAAGASGGGGSGGGDTFNFYAPIYVSGDEGFTNVVTVSARQSGMAGSGTTGGRQSNRQSPTPHAPNASQPYTPVP